MGRGLLLWLIGIPLPISLCSTYSASANCVGLAKTSDQRCVMREDLLAWAVIGLCYAGVILALWGPLLWRYMSR